MDLVERGPELAALTDVLAASSAGRGGAVLVSGGIGCGKSELLDAVRSRAEQDGFVVLAAVGCWAERESPGGVLGQLLRYAEAPWASPGRIAELLDGLGAGGPVPEAEPQTLDAATSAALHHLCTEVLQAAERVPVLICVDDVQFTDAVSQHWLIQLLGRLRSARVALVVAECVLSRPTSPRLRAELLRLPNYRRLPLHRLSPAGVGAVLHRHLDPDTAVALAAEVHQVSAGNPLLVRALVEDQRAADRPPAVGSRLRVGEAYGDAVLSCVLRGRPVLMRLAQALAVLDEGTDTAPLAVRLLDDEEPATVRGGLDALDAAGLLDRGALRHPTAASALRATVPAHDRTRLHRRAAELLYADGAPPTRVARHLVASERGLPAWALPVLRSAAERHLVENRAADAYACVEVALRICDDDSLRVPLKALLTSAAWLLNPSMSARHLGELADALREGRLGDRHALMLAKYLLWHGRFDEAAEAIERIVARGEESDPAGSAELRATREILAASYPALVSGRLRPQERSTARPTRDPRVRSAAALSSLLTGGDEDEAVADAEACMRAMRLTKKTQEALMCAVATLQFADRLPAAASWCDHWLAEARAWQVPLWEAEFASMRASIALRQGNPLLARQLAEAALKQVPLESWGVCIGGPLANLVQAATDTGDHEAASTYLEMPVPEGMFKSRFGLYYLHARGRFQMENGRPHAALNDLVTCGQLMTAWGFDRPALVPWRAEAAQAYLLAGDVARARTLAREQLALVGARPSRTRGMSLRVLAAVSPPGERADLLTEAVEVLRGCGDQAQLAQALGDLGCLHYQAGRPARARPLVETAARLARACGARPILRRLPLEAGPPRPEPADPAEQVSRVAALSLLSGAERRVAALAARGHTNREISRRLCITVSTVEQHLTRTFRKLGVKTRADLPEEIVLDMAVAG
ncbi:ATP-binding protein [Micromonospora narathiwatensis]|uniref:Regulatory protein, luxR family n=1 Tax=Micromonospora narathiwatensis TaxID=299146 RepID=A0A1A8ZH19_9ACTN|nr:LuxR family transcriptional regulator [Micromonospora narathiwatensis]SBT43329.1 regulatory protein, luxR family [Micromonospora narathiwatensis]